MSTPPALASRPDERPEGPVRRRRRLGAVAVAVVVVVAGVIGVRALTRPSESPPVVGAELTDTTSHVEEVMGADAVLYFSDDFDGTTLDGTRWNTCYPWVVDDQGCTNTANDEEQWYLAQQVQVGDGELRLVAEREAVQGTTPQDGTKTYEYRSGMVTNAGHADFLYGYIEIRATIPFDAGLWPGLWLGPSDQSWPPEVDILESFGSRDGSIDQTLHRVGKSVVHKTEILGRPDDPHTFGLLWEPGRLVWYVDGVATFEVTEDVPDQSMYLLANLAVGGKPTTAVDEETVLPAALSIDWIRIWQ